MAEYPTWNNYSRQYKPVSKEELVAKLRELAERKLIVTSEILAEGYAVLENGVAENRMFTGVVKRPDGKYEVDDPTTLNHMDCFPDLFPKAPVMELMERYSGEEVEPHIVGK